MLQALGSTMDKINLNTVTSPFENSGIQDYNVTGKCEVFEKTIGSLENNIYIDKDSEIDYIIYENLNTKEQINRNFYVLENSVLNLKIVCNNSNDVDEKINIYLEGERAEVTYKLVSKALGKMKSNINVGVYNNAKNTKADIVQKGVVAQGGHLTLNATGKINTGMSNSENFQESRVLLLDECSYGESSPILLINNNDVKAGHKASVSRVDDDLIYYIQSRGINKKEAEKLILNSFLAPIFDSIENEEIREELEQGLKKDIM